VNKRVVLSGEALNDINELLNYLDENASPTVALHFFNAVQNTLSTLSRTPGVGALRNFENPALIGMRMLVIPDFSNHLIFYRESTITVEIIRILDGRRDLPAIFGQ
jgi:plasmid stabilization system protein ParE